MTLCIAAACQENDAPHIVICADKKVGTYYAQAEIQFKLRWITGNWPAAIAGDIAKCEEMVATFQTYLVNKKLTRWNVFDEMTGAATAFRQKLAEQIVQRKLSVSYEYLQGNKSKFPTTSVYDVYNQISEIDSGAELLCAGFIEKNPYIFQVDRCCNVTFRDHFAAIGTGAYIAEPALYQRKQQKYEGLSVTLYNVFEAKTLGEIAEGVGKETNLIDIWEPAEPGKKIPFRYVNIEGFKYLGERYEKFGLKYISEIEMQDAFFKVV